jgi:hypothetical protein
MGACDPRHALEQTPASRLAYESRVAMSASAAVVAWQKERY